MSLGNTTENEVLQDILTRHPNLYLALSTADPGEAGSGIAEPVGGSYIRQSIGAYTISGNNLTNDSPATFPIASVAWGLIGWVAVFDAESGGAFVGKTAIVAFDCVANTRVIIAAGTTILSID